MMQSSHSNVKENIHWLWQFWRPHRLWVVWIVFLTIIHAAIAISIPFLYIAIIDEINKGAELSVVRYNIGLLLFLGFLNFCSSYLLTRARARMNIILEWEIRQSVFEHLLSLGAHFFNRFRTGDLVTRLTDDLGHKLSWFACSGIFRSFDSMLRILFSLAAMFFINPVLTLLTLLPLPIQFFTYVKSAGILHKRFSALQKRISKVSEIIESCFSGIRVVQAYTMEKKQVTKFHQAASDRAEAEVSAESAHIIVHSLYGYFWQFALIIVLLAGGWLVISDRMTLGEYVAFDYYIGLLIFPMFDIGNLLVSYRRASVSIERVREIESNSPEIKTPENPISFPSCRGDIEFRHVSLELGDKMVLKDLSFTIKSGELAAFAGSVGSGKSTLFSLIIRQYDPSSGTITLDGLPLDTINIRDLHRHIGYVSQEAVLFSKSIRENIIFGRPGISDNDINEAIEIAQMGRDIESFKDGLNTQIGQRGVTLSGGQKQRLALARALVTRPQVLLLDDVTAALDADTEEMLWKRLYKILPGLTCLVITHRPSTLERARIIYVLEEGSIVEQGKHSDLLAKHGLYHRIYSRQKWQQEIAGVSL